MADERSTVDFGTRYKVAKGEAARAAATVRAGEARNAESARARAKRTHDTAVTRAQGYRGAMAKRRQRHGTGTVGTGTNTPVGRIYEKLQE